MEMKRFARVFVVAQFKGARDKGKGTRFKEQGERGKQGEGVICGYSWLFMVIHSYLWLFVVYSWLFVVIRGYLVVYLKFSFYRVNKVIQFYA